MGKAAASGAGHREDGSSATERAGAPVRGARVPGGGDVAQGGGAGSLAWWVAGGLMVVLMVALGYPILTRDQTPGSADPAGIPPGMGEPPAGASSVDITNMTPEEMATGLFNRVMTANSVGDTLGVATHLPMAISVHEELNPTDPDGLYHFALLHLVGGDHEEALAKAREGLADAPDYLLLLAVAGESAAALGDTASASDHYRRFLEVYEEEIARARTGYDHHARILPTYREEALAFLNEG